jgi:hypothetical protein
MSYGLHIQTPSPINAYRRIACDIPERSRVQLEVYNLLGNIVATLASGERMRGSYQVQWRGENLPSGMYLIRLQAESLESSKRFISTSKAVLMK